MKTSRFLNVGLILGCANGLSSKDFFDVNDLQEKTELLIDILENDIIPDLKSHANFNSNAKATTVGLEIGGALTCAAAASGFAFATPFGTLTCFISSSSETAPLIRKTTFLVQAYLKFFKKKNFIFDLTNRNFNQ